MKLNDWLQKAQQRLAVHSEIGRLEAQVLLAEVLKKPRAWLMAHPEFSLSQEICAVLEAQLSRLEDGEPLPYLLGHWEFYGLDFFVTPDVLIPRPETELLVEVARNWLRKNLQQKPTRPIRAVDVGTGSGCIAISLAVHTPNLEILALDTSMAALEIARKNVIRHHVECQVKLIASDLLSSLAKEAIFDLICANLPYIPSERLPTLAVYGREPTSALDGRDKGSFFIERLIHESQPHLAIGGLLLLEIDHTQGKHIRNLAQSVFPQAEIRVHPDLAGLERLVSVQLPF